jgi:hypothetical protein
MPKPPVDLRIDPRAPKARLNARVDEEVALWVRQIQATERVCQAHVVEISLRAFKRRNGKRAGAVLRSCGGSMRRPS